MIFTKPQKYKNIKSRKIDKNRQFLAFLSHFLAFLPKKEVFYKNNKPKNLKFTKKDHLLNFEYF
tara:strand:- start:423 stop:614 length:192 start_codon:yes stop_codon:yes gene_type:complete